jgi:prophage maintenance system killer protein
VEGHHFIDGNKRIAATLAAYYLNGQKMSCNHGLQSIITNDALFPLAVRIAENNYEKDTITNDIADTFRDARGFRWIRYDRRLAQ